MIESPETPHERRQWRLAQLEKAMGRTLITSDPYLKEAEIRLRIYELFRLDQIAASQETKTAP